MHPDPAEAMLRVARARAGGDRVEWRRGTAELIEPASADLAVDRVWSDWHGRPFDAAEHPLMIIEACPQGA